MWAKWAEGEMEKGLVRQREGVGIGAVRCVWLCAEDGKRVLVCGGGGVWGLRCRLGSVSGCGSGSSRVGVDVRCVAVRLCGRVHGERCRVTLKLSVLFLQNTSNWNCAPSQTRPGDP